LALLGRLPSRRVDASVIQASEKPAQNRTLLCSSRSLGVSNQIKHQSNRLPPLLAYHDCHCEVIRDAADRAKAGRLGIWSGTFQLP
jgi:hypothetical protein